ncbi:hypothetical protein Trydic_g20328 [Trypoxylus dichotomus]
MALSKNRKEKLAEEMSERKFYECIEMERAKIDQRNKFRNLHRYMQIQRKQMDDDDRAEKEKQLLIREAEVKREEKLAQEMDKMKRKEIKELRMRQILRENCPELRDLESKLRAAYVNKQLLTQLKEKEALKLEEKLKEKKVQEVLSQARMSEEEFQIKEAEAQIKRKAEYKQALQDQMILREKTRRHLYEEFLKEKKMIDDIIQRIHEEDERMLEEKWCKVQKTQEEMLAFKAAQKIWKEKRKLALEEENRRIEEYLQMKAREEHMKTVHEHKKNQLKEKLTEDLARQLYTSQMKKREREYIRQELAEREFQEQIEERHKADVEAQIRQRIDLQEVLEKQMQDRRERVRQEQKEEQLYKEQVLAKLMEDQKLEQMSAQKKRMKMLQLKRDVEDMMKERRQRIAEEMQEKIRLIEEEKKVAVKRREIIEEERLKMLKEHAKNLIGHIPRGVLREDDLEHLGDAVADVYLTFTASQANSSVETICIHIKCPAYKTNEDECPLGYIGDSLTGECIPNCGTPCNNSVCSYCYYPIINISAPITLPDEEGLNVLNVETCDRPFCPRKTDFCINTYVIHPYVRYQCIPRCDWNSCEEGWCSWEGTCECRIGYRPDPLNPRRCTRFPPHYLSWLAAVESFQFSIGKPVCEYDNISNVMVCECSKNYKFRDGSFICELELDDDRVATSTSIRILRNMSFVRTEKVIYGETSFYVTVPILAGTNIILTSIVIVLVFFMVKAKREVPKPTIPESRTEEIYDECYYSIPKIDDQQEKPPDHRQLTWPNLTEDHIRQLQERIAEHRRYL